MEKILRDAQSGFNLLEMAVALALIGSVGVLGFPYIFDQVSGLRVELAAGEMAGVLHLARIYSARHNVKVAVKFRTESGGIVTHSLFRDGDGDGVRNRDIVTGVDPEIRPARRLAHFGRRIRFGFPAAGNPPRDPGDPKRRLSRLDDPIRFNSSDLASFNPRGTATPGTIYLTDGRRHLSAVRVNNRSGKITVLSYDLSTEMWR